MIALLIGDCEFLVPGDPWGTPDEEPNILDTVSAWWGLGTYSQNALHWAASQPEHGGTAYVSDLTALRGLASDGLVVEHDGHWTATPTGRELLKEASA